MSDVQVGPVYFSIIGLMYNFLLVGWELLSDQLIFVLTIWIWFASRVYLFGNIREVVFAEFIVIFHLLSNGSSRSIGACLLLNCAGKDLKSANGIVFESLCRGTTFMCTSGDGQDLQSTYDTCVNYFLLLFIHKFETLFFQQRFGYID